MSALYPEDHAEPSRTDDPQAKYGEQHMRNPLLSYSEMDRLSEGRLSEFWGGLSRAMIFYENEITEGRLRKVIEVQLVPNDYDCYLTCTGCHDGIPYYVWDELPDTMKLHCPGCGQPITKP